jgi:hypothetical protein
MLIHHLWLDGMLESIFAIYFFVQKLFKDVKKIESFMRRMLKVLSNKLIYQNEPDKVRVSLIS